MLCCARLSFPTTRKITETEEFKKSTSYMPCVVVSLSLEADDAYDHVWMTPFPVLTISPKTTTEKARVFYFAPLVDIKASFPRALSLNLLTYLPELLLQKIVMV
jgi:hypothetical protein